MDSERWSKLRRVFEGARALDGEAQLAFVASECGEDRELYLELEAMLQHEPLARGYLEAAPALPRRIGAYAILRELGHGGMGTVCLAHQTDPPRDVALKVLHPLALTPQAIRRFEHEASVLARLLHPGIAQIYATGTAEILGAHVPWFAMELVDGRNLLDYANARNASTRERVELLIAVCAAVQHAHQRGVIHRDLKPANILVDAAGRPKVLDFGIARSTDADVHLTTVETHVGALIGTLPYMSPEQVSGDPSEIDTRSDVYALGVVAYELLAGALPYAIERATVAEAARVIRDVEPVAPSKRERSLRGDLETILLKTLEKNRERRYASAAELASDLEHWRRDEPISARPPSSIYQLRKLARRHRNLAVALAATLLVLLAGLATTTWQYVRANEHAEQANENAEHEKEQRQHAQRRFEQVRDIAGEFIRFHERIESLAGATPAREALVATALRYLDGLALDAGEDAETRANLADGYCAIGDVQGNPYNPNLGQFDGALASYGKAVEHSEQLLALRPDDVAAGRVLGRALMGLGDVYVVQDRVEDAQSVWRRCFELSRQLAQTHPDRRDLGDDLVRAADRLALAEDVLGRPEEALAMLVSGLTHRRARVAEDASNTDVLHGLALTLGRVADLQRGLDRREEALVSLREARELIERLQRLRPDDAQLRRDAFTAVNLQALLLVETGHAAEAREHATAALQLARTLLEGDAQNVQAQFDLVTACETVGKVEEALAADASRTPEQTREHARSANAAYRQALDTLLGLETQGALADVDNQELDFLRDKIARYEADFPAVE